ncbi:hypothetical protein G6F37_012380 [Rhizopus arrhizus]|nr:hypothetical protein G6F38_012399 [Rhizopus arrhizus]KAG1144001.1 hypothetical protein G6F37_012380 [Rhizopus arrhizus]
MQTLAEQFQSLTLLIQENLRPKPAVINERPCYNCQNTGHDARSCNKPCKLCHGKLGDHIYWECKNYRAKNESNSKEAYLVLSSAASDDD